jgi:hypothetical protein
MRVWVLVTETEKQHGKSSTLREMDHARVANWYVLQPPADSRQTCFGCWLRDICYIKMEFCLCCLVVKCGDCDAIGLVERRQKKMRHDGRDRSEVGTGNRAVPLWPLASSRTRRWLSTGAS